MPLDELKQEIHDGIAFWGYESGGELAGVMGIQDRGEVTLIGHAYVRTSQRRKASARSCSSISSACPRSRS
jgi:hypothetical protein